MRNKLPIVDSRRATHDLLRVSELVGIAARREPQKPSGAATRPDLPRRAIQFRHPPIKLLDKRPIQRIATEPHAELGKPRPELSYGVIPRHDPNLYRAGPDSVNGRMLRLTSWLPLSPA